MGLCITTSWNIKTSCWKSGPSTSCHFNKVWIKLEISRASKWTCHTHCEYVNKPTFDSRWATCFETINLNYFYATFVRCFKTLLKNAPTWLTSWWTFHKPISCTTSQISVHSQQNLNFYACVCLMLSSLTISWKEFIGKNGNLTLFSWLNSFCSWTQRIKVLTVVCC